MVEGIVVDVGVFICGISRVFEEGRTELGAYVYVARIGEGLEDFSKKNIVIAEELENGFILACPEPEEGYVEQN